MGMVVLNPIQRIAMPLKSLEGQPWLRMDTNYFS
jgi:hypothetical protein